MDSSLRAHVRWFLRVLGPAPNPLRRGIDRIESALVALVVLLALLAVPAAATTGTLVYNQGARVAAEQTTSTRHVDAVLLEDGPITNPGSDGGVKARASWPGVDGKPHTDVVPVAVGSKAGTVIPVWVDSADHVTSAPPTSGQVFGSAVIAAAGTLLGVELLCGMAVLAVHSLAVRAMARVWQHEWEVVEPQWRRMQL